ncbi:hypothetical protein [Myxococcus sp. AB025B]|uniref:hypothetical protein n=1 Tax=Myxococcus sp. AB025B TaxID=2562794 RepID=UPI001141180F|nr:hypothetical protein [Myxococcus sp. AB025B]
MESEQPTLIQKEQASPDTTGSDERESSWSTAEVLVIGGLGLLVAIAVVGLFIGVAKWLLKYSLLALGIYVLFSLTRRWLRGAKQQAPSELTPYTSPQKTRAEQLQEIDPAQALARFKAEHMSEAPPPARTHRKP